MNMGMERWGFLFSVVSSPIVHFLTTTRAVCPNINTIMLCAHVCDVNCAVSERARKFPCFSVIHVSVGFQISQSERKFALARYPVLRFSLTALQLRAVVRKWVKFDVG